MIKCLLCKKEFENGRSAHQHMNRVHYEDYQTAGFDLEKMTEGYKRRISHKKKSNDPDDLSFSERPAGLRPLNKSNPAEYEAYISGYRFYDPDSDLAFTLEEMKEEDWI